MVGGTYACGIDWKVPQNHFDGINEWGKLSYWHEVGNIELDHDLRIPLILNFNPTNGTSPYFGKGWMFPLLEAKIVQIDEQNFLLVQPDGISRKFWRKTPTSDLLHGQGEWEGTIRGNSITLWASCGWKLSFVDGKISSFVTPKNREFNMIYSKGIVSELRENGRTILKVENDPQTGMVNGLAYGKEHIDIKLSDKPRVDIIQGVKVVGGIEKSLGTLMMTNGKSETYAYGVDADILPTFQVSNDEQRSFTWLPTSGIAYKDGHWSYKIFTGENSSENVKIERSDEHGQNEFWYNNVELGIETIKALDGTQTVIKRFVSGKLLGKVRTMEYTGNNLHHTVTINYDESGRFLRKKFDDTTFDYAYKPDSTLVTETSKKGVRYLQYASNDGHLQWIQDFDGAYLDLQKTLAPILGNFNK